MQKEIVEQRLTDRLSLHIIWVVMLKSDNESSASAAGRIVTDPRVHQYYDPGRIVGRGYMRDVFASCLRDALAATPRDDPLYEELQQWVRDPGARPLWDAALGYPAGATWDYHVPTPVAWAKQIAFSGAAEGEQPTASFYRNDCKQPPVASDWHREVRDLAASLLRAPANPDAH